jgi:S1-C subfamily serine protease
VRLAARLGAAALLLVAAGCGGSATSGETKAGEAPRGRRVAASRQVFDAVSRSVVAVTNDDKDDREAENKELEKLSGGERRTPKKIVEVSSRSKPMPHGTGFVIPGGRVATAAHVINRPDKLKLTTRAGKTIEAKLVAIDEVRDVALLEPKQPLGDVPPVEVAKQDPQVGEEVWAMGHTGQGLWELSWGLSEGVASGHVNLLGAKLLLFDAAVYPGFSGGPVVMREQGQPRVVGVNHAILFTGQTLFAPLASISSATSVSELNEVIAGRPPAIQAKLAEFAKQARTRPNASLFVTDELSVRRSPNGHQTADIRGDRDRIPVILGRANVPVTAMLFNLSPGRHELTFELRDDLGNVVGTQVKSLRQSKRARIGFASASFDVSPRVEGRWEVSVRDGGTALGSKRVMLEIPGQDDQLIDEDERDLDLAEPTVDVVVASIGNAQPLLLGGVRAGWDPRTLPRRGEGFTWFARGSRGWSGTQVVLNAYVLDDTGKIVGHSMGCFMGEVRPEKNWSCIGQSSGPMLLKAGAYDVVFAINDRPVAAWPMDAALKVDKEVRIRGDFRLKGRPAAKASPAPPDAPPAGSGH